LPPSPLRSGRSRSWRKTNPRFTGENFTRNLAIVDEVRTIGAEIDATPAQTALAWILTRGDDIAPIPGTKRVKYLEENVAAEDVVLSQDELADLNAVFPPRAASGERYPDMSFVNR